MVVKGRCTYQQLELAFEVDDPMQALGKARGDGLGMDFKRADFHIFEEPTGWKATVKIDGMFKPK